MGENTKTQKKSWFKGLTGRVQEDRLARQEYTC